MRAAINGVVREAIIAACLTATDDPALPGELAQHADHRGFHSAFHPDARIIVLSALGETINIMTLGGLALAVGILVDDATVAIENINRNIAHGQGDRARRFWTAPRRSPCRRLSPRLHLHRVCADVLPDRRGAYLFVPLAEAVVFAMLASYLLSRTLVPTMAMYLLQRTRARRRHQRAEPAAIRWCGCRLRFEHGFRAAARAVPRAAAASACSIAGVFLLAFPGVLRLRRWCCWSRGWARTFFPSVDSGQFKLHLRAPTGTRIEETARLCDLVEQVDPRADSARGTRQRSSTTSACPTAASICPTATPLRSAPADADILVSLTEKHRPTAEYVHASALTLAREFPGVTFYFLPADMVSQILNFGLPAPIDVQVVGQQISTTIAHSPSNCCSRLSHVPGTADLRIQQPFDLPKLHDRRRPHAGAAGRLHRSATSPATC